MHGCQLELISNGVPIETTCSLTTLDVSTMSHAVNRLVSWQRVGPLALRNKHPVKWPPERREQALAWTWQRKKEDRAGFEPTLLATFDIEDQGATTTPTIHTRLASWR